MPKAKVDPYSPSCLSREISAHRQEWASGRQVRQREHVEVYFQFIASVLGIQDYERTAGDNNSRVADLDLPVFPDELCRRLRSGADQYVSCQGELLRRQGLFRFSENGLRAFFFSAIYEESRFGEPSPALQKGSRRGRTKRRGGAYFSPPSLAYFAAHRAFSTFSGGLDTSAAVSVRSGLPSVLDPAMGTGLFLVAALDHLAASYPELSREFLAERCLAGVDFDPLTAAVARHCLTIAVGKNKGADGKFSGARLVWADALIEDIDRVDIILGNPPWDIAKVTRNEERPWVPGRVNKAKNSALRRSFQYQGEGDTSFYKLFLERSCQLLRPGGVASLLVPASFCGDAGAAPLRRYLLSNTSVNSLDGFVNSDNVFAIHPNFKYVMLCFKNGGESKQLETRFGLSVRNSILAGTVCGSDSIIYTKEEIELLGGDGLAIVELDEPSDKVLLGYVYKRHASFGKFLQQSGGHFRREFDMTMQRHLFTRIKKQDCLPLVEGRHLDQFNVDGENCRYFIQAGQYRRRVSKPCIKIGFVSVTSPFNKYSVIAAHLPDMPAGSSVPTIVFAADGADADAAERAHFTTAVLNSFVFNWLVRMRLHGTNLSYHILQDMPFPGPELIPASLYRVCSVLSSKLSGAMAEERIRERIWLEMLVCKLYDLSSEQAAYILRHCEHSADYLRRRRSPAESLNGPNLRSFFRVDKGLPPRLRLTNLVRTAYCAYAERGSDFTELVGADCGLPALPVRVEEAVCERLGLCSAPI